MRTREASSSFDNGAQDIAVDTETERLYVADAGNNRINVFEADGTFLFALGWGVDTGAAKFETCTTASGCQAGIEGSGNGQFSRAREIVVDNDPASASRHDIYVYDSGNYRVQKFHASGEFVGKVGKKGTGPGEFNNSGGPLAIGPGGVLYVGDSLDLEGFEIGEPRIKKFDSSLAFLEECEPAHNSVFNGGLAVDSAGNFYASFNDAGIFKFKPDCSEFGAPYPLPGLPRALAVDAADRLYEVHGFPRVIKTGSFFGKTQALTKYDSAGNPLRRFGYGSWVTAVLGIATLDTAFGDVLTGEEFNTSHSKGPAVKYLTEPPPGPVVGEIAASPVGNVRATLNAEINPEGKATEYRFDYVDEQSFESEGGFASPNAKSTPLTALPGEADFDLHLAAAEIGCPDPVAEVGEGKCLSPETTYRYRVVFSNADGTGNGPREGSFETKPPLEIEETYATQVSTDSARLNARVNPLGIPTTGYFEYVDDATYSESGFAEATEVPDVSGGQSPLSFGSGEAGVTRSVSLTLEPGTTYHYRVLATDPLIAEPIAGPERTLTTISSQGTEACPENEIFRTGLSALLPDCRAYELVSPLDKEGSHVIALKDPAGGLPAVLDQSLGRRGQARLRHLPRLRRRRLGPLHRPVRRQPRPRRGVAQPQHPGPAEHRQRQCREYPQHRTETALAGPLPGVDQDGGRTHPRSRRGGRLHQPLPPHRRRMRRGELGSADHRRAGPRGRLAGTAGHLGRWIGLDLRDARQPARHRGPGSERRQRPREPPALLPGGGGEGPHFVCILPSGAPTPTPCMAGTGGPGAGSGGGRESSTHNAIFADAGGVFWSTSVSYPAPIYLRLNPEQPESEHLHGIATGTGNLIGPAFGVGNLIKSSSTVNSLVVAKGAFAVGQSITGEGIAAATTITECTPSCEAPTKLKLSKAATASKTGAELSGEASATVSSLLTETGAFAAGQEISGAGIPAGTTIEAVGAETLTLSAKATQTGVAVALAGTSECTEAATKACTIAVSEAAEGLSGATDSFFWSAADDGSKALFTVVKGPFDGDLYEFGVETETTELIAQDVLGVMGASEDASRVYLASREVLSGANPQGKAPLAGQPNLYLYEEGSFDFIATLVAEDLHFLFSPIAANPDSRTSRVSPDGLHVAFMSAGQPTGYDNTDAKSPVACGKPQGRCDSEVYLYDATANGGDGKLLCASCNPSGARPMGENIEYRGSEYWAAAHIPVWSTIFYAPRVLSADGSRLYFNSSDALSPLDSNGAVDVYQWEAPGSGGCDEGGPDYSSQNEGCIRLISSGQSAGDSAFVDASPTGKDVFFATTESLVSQDYGLRDIYDARVGGGLPAQPAAAPECEGEACQSAPEAPDDPTPASSTFQGAGNVAEAPLAKKACAKGKVRRRGKCVSKHRKKASKKAKNKRRSAR